jgi:4-hydroxy-tetrahydrodipicolinate synthase
MTTASHDQLFAGAFTALITPFTRPDAAAVDLDRLAEQVQFQARAGVRGVVPCGTTGESPTLTESEHRAVVEKTIAVAHPLGLAVIAGSGSNNTAHAVHLHCMANSAGADAALHVTPYYNKPSQNGLYAHFMTIADSCALPIVLYNIPGRTAVALTIETIERLAAHPNIQAIKEATGDVALAGAIIERTDLVVLSGDDPLTLPLGSLGATGVVSVLSNVLPERVAALCAAIRADDWPTARAIHEQLLPLACALLSSDVNPVPVKTVMAGLGRDSGLLRLPLVAPPSVVAESLQRLFAPYRTMASPALV